MAVNNNVTKATVWAIIDRFSSQIVAFLIGVILARLLTPDDYGIIGMTTIFIAISNVFIDSGFANGLIRKLDRTESDLSTAFIFNIVVGVFSYFVLYFSAPTISDYFSEPLLTPVLRIIGLNIIFLSLSVVQTALFTAKLDIKSQALINLLSLIPSGIVAIIAAYSGLGVYSLALQTVLSSFIKMILLWTFSKWYPKTGFSRASFRYLWSFGSKLLLANIIGTIFNEIYSVLIGKYIGKTDLGYYSKASHLNQNVNGTTTGIVQKISLPVLTKYQEDTNELRDRFSNLMRILVLFIAPLSACLFYLSKDLVLFLWTDKWLDCVPIFKMLIIGTMFGPIGQMSLSLLQVSNRTDIILKLEAPKKIVYCMLIAIGFQYGVIGLAFVQILINMIASLFNMYPTKSLLNYSYWRQIIDVFKYMILSYLIGCAVYITLPIFNPVWNITIYAVVFLVAYVVTLVLIKDKIVMDYIINYIKNSKKNV